MNPVIHQSGPALLDLHHATVVFLGGAMTLADGSAVDSRQPMDGGTSRAVRRALTASEQWWSAVASIVVPTLDAVPGAFALVTGARTAARATTGGSLRRVSLKRTLTGGFGGVTFLRGAPSAELPSDFRRVGTLRSRQGAHMGSLGVKTADAGARWRFAQGSAFYLSLVADQLGAHVVVDATGAFVAGAYGPVNVGSLSIEFEDRSLARSPELVVVPDTQEMRALVQGLLDGTRVAEEGVGSDGGSFPAASVAPHDAHAFPRLVATRADCSITAMLRDGQWQDPAGLEAARVLLLRRYDLKLGLWDVAMNPVLRATLLDRSPVAPIPENAAVPSAAARAKAGRDSEDAKARRAASVRGVQQLTRFLEAELAELGWRAERQQLSFPLTGPLSTWPGAEKDAVVKLQISVAKNLVQVAVWHAFYNDLDLSAFIAQHWRAFDAIAPLQQGAALTSTVALWSTTNGWADPASWAATASSIGSRTGSWAALLADFVASCLEVRRARFERVGAPC